MAPARIPQLTYTDIPTHLIGSYLPKLSLSIPELLSYDLHPIPIAQVPSPSIALTIQPPSTQLTNSLLHSLNIPEKIILDALIASLTVKAVGARAVNYKDKAGAFLLPLSVLKVWITVWDLHQTRHIWGNADDWIARNSRWSTRHSEVADRIRQRLLITAWSGHLAGFTAANDPVASIAGYASNGWLSDQHIQQVQDIMRHELNLDASLQSRWIIEDVFFSQKVQEAYQVREDGVPKSIERWLNRVGEELATGRKQTVIGVVHVGGNHWVAFAVDFPSRSISFSDPFGTTIPQSVIASFKWWTSCYHSEPFSITQLQVTHQQDSVSCGILALNALQHALSTKTRLFPLISSDISSLSLARLQHFDSVLQRHLSQYQREVDHFNPPGTQTSAQSHRSGADEDEIECIGSLIPSPTSRAKGSRSQRSVVIEIHNTPSPHPTRSSSVPPLAPPPLSSPQEHLASHEYNTPDYSLPPSPSIYWNHRIDSEWGSLDGYLTDPDSMAGLRYYEYSSDPGDHLFSPNAFQQYPLTPLSTSPPALPPALPPCSPLRPLKRSPSPTPITEHLSKHPKYDIRHYLLTNQKDIAEHNSRRREREADERAEELEEMERFQEVQREDRRRKEREKKARQRAKRRAEKECHAATETTRKGVAMKELEGRSAIEAKPTSAEETPSGVSSGPGSSVSGGQRRQLQRSAPAVVPSLPYTTTVAELSRPKRSLAAARRPDLISPTKLAKNVNWKAGFIWPEIDAVARRNNFQSSSAIVAELKIRNPAIFATLTPQVLGRWIEQLPTGERRWKEKVIDRVEEGYNTRGEVTRFSIFSRYPDIIDSFTGRVVSMRRVGLPVDVTSSRAFLIGYIQSKHPQLFQEPWNNKPFTCSESFVRKLFCDCLGWSQRMATRAAQKVPVDWEEQCRRARLRIAYLIKEYDIPAGLIVNFDQTQCIYSMSSSLTWTMKGEKQVPVVGKEEKRAITVTVPIKADGSALPIQATYLGRSSNSLPSPDSTDYDACKTLGIRMVYSGTSTYWANLKTIQDLIDNTIAPNFERVKLELGLPPSQKSILYLDVWSVHRSEAFRDWMQIKHPTILLVYVPANCTGLFQPCDTGAQRPFKHAIRRAQVADAIEETSNQISQGRQPEDVKLSTSLPVLRNRTPRWLLQGYKALTREVVLKAFELCRLTDPSQNLSYTSLTSVAIRQDLRNLRRTHPDLYKDLTQVHSHSNSEEYIRPSLPELPAVVSEDSTNGCDSDESPVDDSDVTTEAVTSHILGRQIPQGCVVDLESNKLEGESIGAEADEEAVEHGKGDDNGREDGTTQIPSKRSRKKTKFFVSEFWNVH